MPEPDAFELLLRGLKIRCPGCVSYYQCGSVEAVPVALAASHLVDSHGWTEFEVRRWLDTGAAPRPAHRR